MARESETERGEGDESERELKQEKERIFRMKWEQRSATRSRGELTNKESKSVRTMYRIECEYERT